MYKLKGEIATATLIGVGFAEGDCVGSCVAGKTLEKSNVTDGGVNDFKGTAVGDPEEDTLGDKEGIIEGGMEEASMDGNMDVIDGGCEGPNVGGSEIVLAGSTGDTVVGEVDDDNDGEAEDDTIDDVEGEAVVDSPGNDVGNALGDAAVGRSVGDFVCDVDGAVVGYRKGAFVGVAEGSSDFATFGEIDEVSVEVDEGISDGFPLALMDGTCEGDIEFLFERLSKEDIVGLTVRLEKGALVRFEIG